jgi:PAS domain S-box-containing protein
MSNPIADHQSQHELRERALTRIASPRLQGVSRASASDAMGVLHELASSPDTAADALALLHELQVHQVELELQEEELRRSRAEIESRLGRHAHLYNLSPAACISINREMAIIETNWAGAVMLGYAGEELQGKILTNFLAPDSGNSLSALVARLTADNTIVTGTVDLMTVRGTLKSVRAALRADPASNAILLALIDLG